jgi:hypothetical protein
LIEGFVALDSAFEFNRSIYCTFLGVFENKVRRRIFGQKRDEVTGGWKNCITRSFVICTLPKYN